MSLAGIYRHFKGNYYEVVGKAIIQGSEDELVVYRQMYDVFGYWMRPIDMFLGERETANGPVKRFAQVGMMFNNSLDSEDISKLTIGHSELQTMFKVIDFTKNEEDGYILHVEELS